VHPRIVLRPSPRLAALIGAAHAGAAGGFWLALPGAAGWALAGLALALGAASGWDRALLRGRGSPRALQLAGEGGARIEFADGTDWPVAKGWRSVNRFWVALPLERARRRTVLITGDMLDPGQFRLLRLWALWGRLPGVASAQLPG